MKNIGFFKVALFSAAMYLSVSVGIAYEPNPNVGGPVLTIQNDTDFTLTFPWINTLRYTLPELSTASRFYPEPVHAHTCPEVRFNWGGFEYWFGAAGRVSGELTITSDEWEENKAIVVVLKKEKKDALEFTRKKYSGAITPLMNKDKKEGKEQTPRITWKLEWNDVANNGWKITLKQSEVDISNIPEIIQADINEWDDFSNIEKDEAVVKSVKRAYDPDYDDLLRDKPNFRQHVKDMEKYERERREKENAERANERERERQQQRGERTNTERERTKSDLKRAN